MSYSPEITEVTYAGRGSGAAFTQNVTTSLYRTDDMVRGIYRLRMDVKQAMRFKRFVFVQSGADTYAFDKDQLKVAYCNEDGISSESPDPQIVGYGFFSEL